MARLTKFNTVESYDVVAEVWTPMPNMMERRQGHSLVVVKNKLFVIGGSPTLTWECFDNKTKIFVAFKSPRAIGYNKSLSIGIRIIIFQSDHRVSSSVVVYDVHEDKLSEESCETFETLSQYACVKLYIFKKERNMGIPKKNLLQELSIFVKTYKITLSV